MTRMVCTTSVRLANKFAVRSQTAVPSRLTNGFFSRPPNREDLPAAGRMTAKLAIGGPPNGLPMSYENKGFTTNNAKDTKEPRIERRSGPNGRLRTCLIVFFVLFVSVVVNLATHA